MPTWARPSDVHFDHAAAQAALGAIAAARFTFEWAWVTEERSAGAALGSWAGLAADTFATSHRARRRATADIVDRLGLLAASIEDGIDRAVVEQARVDALQDEWDAQRLLEVAAETSRQNIRSHLGSG